MWWLELQRQRSPCRACTEKSHCLHVADSAIVEDGARLDTSLGPIVIGPRTRICAGATVAGPVRIGADCLIGTMALVRGPTTIGDKSRFGFAAEIKHAIIGDRVTVGPQCFVGDSMVEDDVYLGAQVRTSNHRLDTKNVEVIRGDERFDTGLEKLGCRIGARSALGIQVIVLPGRSIAPDTLIGPRITVERNLPAGRYRISQPLETF